MFILTILEKIKETRLKFSQESVKVLQTMANYQEARVKQIKKYKIKLTNTKLNKLKSAEKNNTGTISRINEKNFVDEDEELPDELLLRQTIKIRNDFANNLSTDIRLSKTQIPKIIQSGEVDLLVLG